MKIFLSLIAFALLPLNMVSQGILDSLTSSNNYDTLEESNNNVNQYIPSPNNYRYADYVKDSITLANLHDSIASQWTFDDSLPEKKEPVVLFSANLNKELNKNNPRPPIFTGLFFVVLLGFVIKATFFGNKMALEFGAGIRALGYDEWFASQLVIINVYNVLSKLLSICLHALVISYVLFRLSWTFSLSINIMVLLVLLGLIAIIILKYFLGWFFGVIFQNPTLIKHHFTVNQLNDNLLFLPLLLCFVLSYFLNGLQNVDWMLVVGAVLIALDRVISIASFGVTSLLSRDNKKLYVFFYLCTLEIIPVLVFVKFMAVSYL